MNTMIILIPSYHEIHDVTDQRTKLFKKVARRQLQGVVQFEYIGK
jgi:hypothetical protein